MIRPFKIKVENKQELFLAYLKTINWTLPEQLSEAELEVLSYLVTYYDSYKEIKSDKIKFNLLFSPNVKKEIKEEFNIDTQKFETYLNKLRKKKIITTKLHPLVVISAEELLEVRFTIEIKPKEHIEPEKVYIPEPEPEFTEVPEVSELQEYTNEDERLDL